MDAISELWCWYADGGAVGIIDDTSDWSSFFAFEPAFFGFAYFYFLEGDFEGDLGAYFYLLFDFPDFTDLSSFAASPFFLLFESLPISNCYCLNFIIIR